MGEIADYMVEQLMEDHLRVAEPYRPYRGMQPQRREPIPNSYGERPNWGERRRGRANERGGKPVNNRNTIANGNVEREVTKLFKVVHLEDGAYAVILERGMYRESIALTFGRKKFVSRGFAKKEEGLYNRGTAVELINMHAVVHGLVELLNNLNSAELLVEYAYNNVMDAFEPFLEEALDYEEVEPYLEETALGATKKKRISRRDRGSKTKTKK